MINQANFFSILDIKALFSSPEGKAHLRKIYGEHADRLDERARFLATMSDRFASFYGENCPVQILRIPGRINLLGIHIDHQGGRTNYKPIGRETIFFCSPRSDDRLIVHNIDPIYPPFEFSLSEEIPSERRGHWPGFLQYSAIIPGFWGNYIKAAACKAQDEYADRPLRGINLLIGGTIPPNAGVSSSSTLVIGTFMALVERNGLDIPREKMVELCGSAEWYVGTRGGCGDHAAMLLGRQDSILHSSFKPFSVRRIPFPDELSAILIYSGIESKKAAGSRERFNSRIAAYELSFLLFKKNAPNHVTLDYLRDATPEAMKIPLSEYFRIIKHIPVEASFNDLKYYSYPSQEQLDILYDTFQIPAGPLPLRETFLFGIAECRRSNRFAQALEEQRWEEAGKLMYISHDGDRVSQWTYDLSRPYRSAFTDAYLDRLCKGSASENKSWDSGDMPGGYRCSVPELDRIVDLCKECPEILGARLTGAGLGGSVVALARTEHAAHAAVELQNRIREFLPATAFAEVCARAQEASFLDIPVVATVRDEQSLPPQPAGEGFV